MSTDRAITIKGDIQMKNKKFIRNKVRAIVEGFIFELKESEVGEINFDAKEVLSKENLNHVAHYVMAGFNEETKLGLLLSEKVNPRVMPLLIEFMERNHRRISDEAFDFCDKYNSPLPMGKVYDRPEPLTPKPIKMKNAEFEPYTIQDFVHQSIEEMFTMIEMNGVDVPIVEREKVLLHGLSFVIHYMNNVGIAESKVNKFYEPETAIDSKDMESLIIDILKKFEDNLSVEVVNLEVSPEIKMIDEHIDHLKLALNSALLVRDNLLAKQ